MHTHNCTHNCTPTHAAEGGICGTEEGTSGCDAVVMWGVTATSAQHGELAMAQRCLQCAFISYPGWASGWIWNYWFIDQI